MHRRKKVDEKSCVTFLLCDPGCGTSSELDVQNEWRENTHTHYNGNLSHLRIDVISF